MRLAVGLLLAANALLFGCALYVDPPDNLPVAKVAVHADPLILTFTSGENSPQISGGQVHLSASVVGVTINRFSCEFIDDHGLPLDWLAMAKQNLGQTTYLPISTGNNPADTTFNVPGLVQNLTTHARSASGAATESLVAKLTIYGQDDSYNEVDVPVDMTVTLNGATLFGTQHGS